LRGKKLTVKEVVRKSSLFFIYIKAGLIHKGRKHLLQTEMYPQKIPTSGYFFYTCFYTFLQDFSAAQIQLHIGSLGNGIYYIPDENKPIKLVRTK